MTKLTTADYRQLARKAEKDLEWKDAVYYWKRALEEYPILPGALTRADKDKIITAINADQEMMKNE